MAKYLKNNLEKVIGLVFVFWLTASIFIHFEPLNHFPSDDSAVFLYITSDVK